MNMTICSGEDIHVTSGEQNGKFLGLLLLCLSSVFRSVGVIS